MNARRLKKGLQKWDNGEPLGRKEAAIVRRENWRRAFRLPGYSMQEAEKFAEFVRKQLENEIREVCNFLADYQMKLKEAIDDFCGK